MTTLNLYADRTLIRAAGASVRYVLASITAPTAAPRDERMPVNISLVLDRSGSMAGDDKFPLALEAVRQSLKMLTPTDRFSLVVFDDRVDVIIPSTLATRDAKARAFRTLESINPRGSTDLCSGWMNGCEQLSAHLANGTITRVLLLTDGQANAGEVNRDVLARHASELRQRGITTSTFGVGADFDEQLLRDLATAGGGNFYFVERAAQVVDLMTSELGEALEVVIARATLTVTLPRGAEVSVLNRFVTRPSLENQEVAIDLGDLISGQELDVALRVKFSLGEVGNTLTVRASLSNDVRAQIAFTYAGHSTNDAQPRDRRVDREVARLYAARARAGATEANRNHDYETARRVLTRTAGRISEYAGSDVELNAIATALNDEVSVYAEQVMSPMALKAAFYVAESSAKGRDAFGKARKAK